MAEYHQSSLNRTFEDQFLFTFNLPKPLKDLHSQYVLLNHRAGISKETIDFSLIGVNLPRINTKSEAVPYSGSNLYISSHTRSAYDPLVIKFNIDSNYANYYTIYMWLNYIYDHKQGYFDAHNISDTHNIDSYQTNVSITALDPYQNPIIQWICTHAFPSDLSAIEYNYQDSKELQCTATFEFAQLFIRHIALDKLTRDPNKV